MHEVLLILCFFKSWINAPVTNSRSNAEWRTTNFHQMTNQLTGWFETEFLNVSLNLHLEKKRILFTKSCCTWVFKWRWSPYKTTKPATLQSLGAIYNSLEHVIGPTVSQSGYLWYREIMPCSPKFLNKQTKNNKNKSYQMWLYFCCSQSLWIFWFDRSMLLLKIQ